MLEEQQQAVSSARRPGEGRRVGIIGAPCGFGASVAGVDLGPAAMRVAGLRQRIASLGYDVVQLVADILRRKGIDGTAAPARARETLMQGMVETKEYLGVNRYEFRENGDAYIPSRALRIDPARSEWAFLD